MLQKEQARNNIITKEMEQVAEKENVSSNFIKESIVKGTIVITKHNQRNIKPIGIGENLKIKINANIGTSPLHCDLNEELEKLKIAVKYGSDTVMDLSTGGNIDKIRQEILKQCQVPIGTVPIYQAIVDKGDILDVQENDFIKAIEKHCKDGVDFITVHCGVRQTAIPLLKSRIAGVVSRGGSFLVRWMNHHKKENPLYEQFDEILKIARKYDVTLSLGDGLRPGSIKDATDKAQLHELNVLGELTKRAWKQDVQVIVEGPGHVPLHEIEKNIKMQKQICHNAPFYVLGPLVTDIAPGYDHITGAIGGTLAAYYGADFLCYVTPSEHLRLPSIEDVKEGVIASKIAAHAADIARGIKGADERDIELSKARKDLDWEKQIKLSLDPEKAASYRKSSKINDKECTMCGKYCVFEQK